MNDWLSNLRTDNTLVFVLIICQVRHEKFFYVLERTLLFNLEDRSQSRRGTRIKYQSNIVKNSRILLPHSFVIFDLEQASVGFTNKAAW